MTNQTKRTRAMLRVTLVALLGLPTLAQAEELGDTRRDRARSESGELLDGATNLLRPLGPRQVRSGAELRRAMKRRGMKHLRQSQRHRWDEEGEQGRFRHRMVRRRLDDGAMFGGLGDYLDRVPAVTDASVQASALQAATTALQEQGLLGTGEEVRAVATRQLRYRAMSADRTDEQSALMASAVELRRYVDDVPVLGAAGRILVVFDADHSLVELDYQATRYEKRGHRAKKRAGRAGVDRLLERHGMPTPRKRTLRRGGQATTLKDVKCGYFDDGQSSRLRRACQVTLEGGDGKLEQKTLFEDEALASDQIDEKGDTPK